MYAKIKISGVIEIVSGLHIGGSSAFSAIGAVDNPIVRDALSGLPIIPGSSLKGKMRTLLAKSNGTIGNPSNDAVGVLRLFGSTKQLARLSFSDCVLANEKALKDKGVASSVEIKFENTIDRVSGIANPRQMERAVRGSQFPFTLIYTTETEPYAQKSDDKINAEIQEDFETIALGMKLLEYDYLGGSGTRGYGKIKFEDVTLQVVIGKLDDDVLAACTKTLQQTKAE